MKAIFSILIKYKFLILLSFISSFNTTYALTLDKTIEVTELERFALNAQVQTMKGYDIRARRFVVPPGVAIGRHEHSSRPGIVYVESGEIIEFRANATRTLSKGDSLIEDGNTIHSYVNNSAENCILIAFDLPQTINSK